MTIHTPPYTSLHLHTPPYTSVHPPYHTMYFSTPTLTNALEDTLQPPPRGDSTQRQSNCLPVFRTTLKPSNELPMPRFTRLRTRSCISCTPPPPLRVPMHHSSTSAHFLTQYTAVQSMQMYSVEGRKHMQHTMYRPGCTSVLVEHACCPTLPLCASCLGAQG